jgi:hypothetical protein
MQQIQKTRVKCRWTGSLPHTGDLYSLISRTHEQQPSLTAPLAPACLILFEGTVCHQQCCDHVLELSAWCCNYQYQEVRAAAAGRLAMDFVLCMSSTKAALLSALPVRPSTERRCAARVLHLLCRVAYSRWLMSWVQRLDPKASDELLILARGR